MSTQVSITASITKLMTVFDLFFDTDMRLHQALYLLAMIISLYPLVRLHLNQREEAYRGSRETGWIHSIRTLLSRALVETTDDIQALTMGPDFADSWANRVSDDLGYIYRFLGLDDLVENGVGPGDLFHTLFRPPRPVLVTSRINCKFCPVGHRNMVPSLRRRRGSGGNARVWLLDRSFQWVQADLLVASCGKCKAEYYPDRITHPSLVRGKRTEWLEPHAVCIRVSVHGIWVDRAVARAQEKALHRFHSGWANFADWINDGLAEGSTQKLTYRQSKRLFLEHFARRLLFAHGKASEFTLPANSSSETLATAVRNEIGKDKGVLPGSLKHGCMDCTHVKRYRVDLPDAVLVDGRSTDVVGLENTGEDTTGPLDPSDPSLPPNLPTASANQAAPAPGNPRGYVRMMVMDGKTITHKKCAVFSCDKPLVNYKNGRFCQEHLGKKDICGFVACGEPVRAEGALTCSKAEHVAWYKRFDERFHRLSYPGVKRVIRRQNIATENGEDISGPTLEIDLPELEGIPWNKVEHTFRAKTTYCLQTAQWACGWPIGWTKCYRAESPSAVLKFINYLWDGNLEARPGFVGYDKACELLRHIVTQNPLDDWIETTKFIVDAWHYIGHRATDILCRTRCNPAPTDGSQPDLVLVEEDDNGVKHQTRAFNTETAEQLNSWLNGFESQLRQMTDVNYDFYVHVLMLVYSEIVAKRIESKGRELGEGFFDVVNGLTEMDLY
ncbi:hypothetical protein C8F01DRAFT_1246066 [Mycena amicta]|nr:hypothetical protein C8F01DRAFT_1246066 [Mycena amicta]